MNSSHIHTPNDGRGVRDVFVDGKEVTGVVFADTQKGVVRCMHSPIQIDKHKKTVITFTLKGDVEVRPKGLNRG